MEWFDEKIERIKDDKFLYKFICFFLGGPKKRLSYKELFVLIYGLNRRKLGEEKSKKLAMNRILKIYKDLHNNNLPKEVEGYDDK